MQHHATAALCREVNSFFTAKAVAYIFVAVGILFMTVARGSSHHEDAIGTGAKVAFAIFIYGIPALFDVGKLSHQNGLNGEVELPESENHSAGACLPGTSEPRSASR